MRGFSAAYSATGFILPCCYADNPYISDFSELLTQDLKLENNSNVHDIINSRQWLKFFDMLKNDPDQAPKTCKYYCSQGWTTKKVVYKPPNNVYNNKELYARDSI